MVAVYFKTVPLNVLKDQKKISYQCLEHKNYLQLPSMKFCLDTRVKIVKIIHSRLKNRLYLSILCVGSNNILLLIRYESKNSVVNRACRSLLSRITGNNNKVPLRGGGVNYLIL